MEKLTHATFVYDIIYDDSDCKLREMIASGTNRPYNTEMWSDSNYRPQDISVHLEAVRRET